MPWQKIFEQTRGDFFPVLPEAMLVFFGLAILFTDFFLTKPRKILECADGDAGSALQRRFAVHATGVCFASVWSGARFYDSIRIDPFFIFFGFLFLASTALAILISVRYMEIENDSTANITR